MESLFEAGDIVYVQGKIITVEEQDTDVRYSVVTKLAKFFCTEKMDKIRRSADSQNMLKKSFEEGKAAYHDVLQKIAKMTDEQKEEVFDETDVSIILEDHEEANDIIELYSSWVRRMNVQVSDIVTYKPEGSSNVYDCIVLSAVVTGPDDTTINCEDLTEDQQADPELLATKVLTLYDPENRIFFYDVKVQNIESIGKRIDANSYLEDMRKDFEDIMNDDEAITGVNIKQVESRNDINYDEYYDDFEGDDT